MGDLRRPRRHWAVYAGAFIAALSLGYFAYTASRVFSKASRELASASSPAATKAVIESTTARLRQTERIEAAGLVVATAFVIVGWSIDRRRRRAAAAPAK